MNRNFVRTVGAAIVGMIVASSGSASAVQALYTAPARAGWGADKMYCTVVNAGTTPVVVTIETYDYQASLKASAAPVTLQPGAGDWLPNLDANDSYCRFVLDQGSKKNIRGAAVYLKNGLWIGGIAAQ